MRPERDEFEQIVETRRFWRRRYPRQRRLVLTVRRVYENSPVRHRSTAVFQLGDSQNVDITAAPLDNAGNPIPNPNGTMAYTVDDPSLVTVTPDASNQFVVNVRSLGGLGTVTLTATHTPVSDDPNVPASSPDSGTLGIQIVTTAEVGVGLTPGIPVAN